MFPKKTVIVKFIRKNYFLLGFLLTVAFIGALSVYTLFIKEPVYIFAKVKIGQGYWWAYTAEPKIWLTAGLKKGDRENSLGGQTEAEILNIYHYPEKDSYATYLHLKLRVKRILQ